jgi:hypothetical protein
MNSSNCKQNMFRWYDIKQKHQQMQPTVTWGQRAICRLLDMSATACRAEHSYCSQLQPSLSCSASSQV